MSASELSRALVDELGILPLYKQEGTPESMSRWENVQELLSAISEFSDDREDGSLEVPGEAVWADDTVTLGGVKQGLLRFPAAERVGRLIATPIGIPESAESDLRYGCLDTRTVRVILARSDAGLLALVTTDLAAGAAALITRYAARWSIWRPATSVDSDPTRITGHRRNPDGDEVPEVRRRL